MDNFTRQTSTPNTPEYASPGVSPRLIDLYSPPPPSKKRRLLGKAPSDLSDQVDVHSPNSPLLVTSETFDSDGNGLSAGLESALVDIKPEYDLTRTEDENGLSALDQCGIPSDSRKWIRGESSIYVDAFNLALDTVLEDESHLFDERERRVFDEWKRLDYESQYLYVRLFLRKTASWHRVSRLGYHSDISDMGRAVSNLQKSRDLPESVTSFRGLGDCGLELEDICIGEFFSFADSSEAHITSVEDAANLLSFEEMKVLGKEWKLQGKTKSELCRALCRTNREQAGLLSMGIQRSRGSNSLSGSHHQHEPRELQGFEERRDRASLFVEKVLGITGPCIRISQTTFKLFERVHLVFYRSTEWTEKSLTTIILSKISRRNFADYLVGRTSNIFISRSHILEFEAALRLEANVDSILEQGDPPREKGFQKVIDLFESIYAPWKAFVASEQVKENTVYDYGEGAYLRRFTSAHILTRIVHQAAWCFGRLKNYRREYDILVELLAQRLFHAARRGSWYQRKALLEEHYMYAVDHSPASSDEEQCKKYWRRKAADTCEYALQDSECHLIYHHDLQKRLTKLEKRLRVPRRLQHDFKHVQLDAPLEHIVEGIQIKRDTVASKKSKAPSTKTVWVDELEDGAECSVEEMCLSWYRHQGWKGYHSEGGIIRTLFAYLFFDIIFLYVPNVFQTAYQSCPLDLHTDAFYPSRASEINRRLADISNGGAEKIVREVYNREHKRKTCVVGLNWDFDVDDLADLVSCFDGHALAAVCKVLAQEYRQRGGGMPDLILWRTEPEKACMFVEVKSANDRLSDTQRLWIHVLKGAGVNVALCHAKAREVRVE
ncbi:hypothetical protein jhhlp_002238 [Lomentospora prolificans]|uniref:Fanconi-associated nuclease n=1 Tax=Lomentospora prolificans TaxID=41688 RepID=A0A2N3NDE2_9PEZI|nr:hypothetical protein jhhlp_002238 [Lomentospora prolificans]